jgi:hypothetical protein
VGSTGIAGKAVTHGGIHSDKVLCSPPTLRGGWPSNRRPLLWGILWGVSVILSTTRCYPVIKRPNTETPCAPVVWRIFSATETYPQWVPFTGR